MKQSVLLSAVIAQPADCSCCSAVALPVAELSNGESIAVDGVCLTVTSFSQKGFAVDVSPESLDATTLGSKKAGARVNLERALRLSDRLGGHLVSGHVDGQATLQSVRRAGAFTRLDFNAPKDLLAFMIVKGSVAIDGISLTINTVESSGFSVMIIPHTLAQHDAVRSQTRRAGKH